MCGICGFYNYHTGAPAELERLRAMTAAIVHRGPDDEGFHVDGSLGLGMRRLSIIDVAGGHQPISNEDGSIWIVFNGEIYNYPDLRRELEALGHVFRTRSDTETIVHGYETWGDEVLARLNGMFGLALWDSRRRRLLLARDHFGVKPLYYHLGAGWLAFASELKCLLLHPEAPRSIDPAGLDLALEYGFIPSPYTLFSGIAKLGPGHRLVVENGRISVERYWRPIPAPDRRRTEADWTDALRVHLAAAVKRQMISDVPIGALLSGGVDSTAVVTLMRQHNQQVRTFSIGVRDAPDSNELSAARATARRLGTTHAEIEIGPQEYMDFIETGYWHLEEPCTPSALLTFFVCKLARQSVKVVLTGQGADEPFGGYARYRGEYFGQFYRRLPAPLTQRLVPGLLNRVPGLLRLKRGAYALTEVDTLARFRRIYSVFNPVDRQGLFRPDLAAALPPVEQRFDPLHALTQGVQHLDSLDQLLYVDARCLLSDNLLIFGDKMSMAASVEARVPMLDLELMDVVENIPASLRLKNGQPKYLLKRALAEWLPAEVLQRRKLGFQVPEAQWFRGSFFDYLRDHLLSDRSLTAAYFRRDRVEALLDTHRRGHENLWRQIFTLLSVELLYQLYVVTPPHSSLSGHSSDHISFSA